jgi:hypothetical protein
VVRASLLISRLRSTELRTVSWLKEKDLRKSLAASSEGAEVEVVTFVRRMTGVEIDEEEDAACPSFFLLFLDFRFLAVEPIDFIPALIMSLPAADADLGGAFKDSATTGAVEVASPDAVASCSDGAAASELAGSFPPPSFRGGAGNLG